MIHPDYRPIIKERRVVVIRVIEKIKDFVKTFLDGVDLFSRIFFDTLAGVLLRFFQDGIAFDKDSICSRCWYVAAHAVRLVALCELFTCVLGFE